MIPDDSLTQEEIEALTSGALDTGSGSGESSDALSETESEVLKEIGNLILKSSANALSTTCMRKVDMEVSFTDKLEKEKFTDFLVYPAVITTVDITQGYVGNFIFLFNSEDIARLYDLMLGGDGSNVEINFEDEDFKDGAKELLNVMMGQTATKLTSSMGRNISFAQAKIDILDEEDLDQYTDYVHVVGTFQIEEFNKSSILIMVPPFLLSEFVSQSLENDMVEDYSTEPVRGTDLKQDFGGLQKEQAREVEFPQLQPKVAPESPYNIDLLLDVNLQVSVELGRTKMLVREILNLKNGTVIPLEKLAGEPVDILVNNRVIAKGEVVVIEENFGVRITNLLGPEERIQSLRGT